MRPISARKRGMVVIVAGGVLALSGMARAADTVYRWEALQKVRRIAVVPPFFCTETPPPKLADGKDHPYQSTLQSLTQVMRTTLPVLLSEQGRFRVAPLDLTDRALKALRWTPCDLFANKGIAQGRQWPAPDLKRIVLLAKRLKVDAVFVGTMREPASIGEGMQFHHEAWDPNPLNWGLERIHAHVVSPRVQAFLITRDGVIAWTDEQMAEHPRTRQRTTRTLLVDWQEATQQVAQQLADSLLRLPPPEREPKQKATAN
ncbi:MAG TPA: hypothetical protein VFB38_07460 [Chthonomonadaceae bacterium]|nr:hypothetical protein [Chthonomonadaceae bacterium]